MSADKDGGAISVEEYTKAQEKRLLGNSSTLAWIMSAIAMSGRAIAAKLERAGIDDILGNAGTDNVQGEAQQKLDVIANDIMMAALGAQEGVATLGSEEDDELTLTGSTDANGNRFAVFFDPLDGSSNLDVGGNRRLQPGDHLVQPALVDQNRFNRFPPGRFFVEDRHLHIAVRGQRQAARDRGCGHHQNVYRTPLFTEPKAL